MLSLNQDGEILGSLEPELQEKLISIARGFAPKVAIYKKRYPLHVMDFTDPFCLNQLRGLWETTLTKLPDLELEARLDLVGRTFGYLVMVGVQTALVGKR